MNKGKIGLSRQDVSTTPDALATLPLEFSEAPIATLPSEPFPVRSSRCSARRRVVKRKGLQRTRVPGRATQSGTRKSVGLLAQVLELAVRPLTQTWPAVVQAFLPRRNVGEDARRTTVRLAELALVQRHSPKFMRSDSLHQLAKIPYGRWRLSQRAAELFWEGADARPEMLAQPLATSRVNPRCSLSNSTCSRCYASRPGTPRSAEICVSECWVQPLLSSLASCVRTNQGVVSVLHFR